MSDISPTIEGAFVSGRLIGIPSYHYDPIFAKIATQALATFRPSTVALELPEGLINELDWAASCWPGPVVSASQSALFPFVPGDSIFEAFRAARASGTPVVLVDLPAAEPAAASPKRRRGACLPGPELSRARASLFLEATDALLAETGPEAPWNIAREAHMARCLSQLLEQGDTVMWVGGMAHWTRIVARITDGNFDSPAVDLAVHSAFRRMRLAPSALYRMTDRLPWLVARYAQDPVTYHEDSAIQGLCLEATKKSDRGSVVLVLAGQSTDSLDVTDEKESATPIDLARTLQYARNLAAAGDMRDRPMFAELLTSAAATIGRRYAGRLYEVAMKEHTSSRAAEHDALEWELADGRERYRCGDQIIDSKPWWPPRGGLPLTIKEIRRRADDELYKDLPPAGKDSKRGWECAPDDEESYVSFVEYVLRRASLTDPEEVKAVPFRTGLRDGLDVRATLKNWAKGTIYVREEQRGHLNFRNGVIDWVNASEHSDILTGKKAGGWIDPDFVQLGSCSRETDTMELLQEDPRTQRDHREFTLITLDAPTFVPAATPGVTKPGPKTFFALVIQPLIDIRGTKNDNLYGWLNIMFAFCSGKPFAYYSRYVPSPKIHRIAWQHKVQLIHFPLQRLPAELLNRHKTFRFFGFTREQWEEFQRRRAARTGTWSG